MLLLLMGYGASSGVALNFLTPLVDFEARKKIEFENEKGVEFESRKSVE